MYKIFYTNLLSHVHRKINKISTIELLICSILLIVNLLIYNIYTKNLADIYQIAIFNAIYWCIFVAIVIYFYINYIKVNQKITKLLGLTSPVILLLVTYTISILANLWLTDIFPFSANNLKYTYIAAILLCLFIFIIIISLFFGIIFALIVFIYNISYEKGIKNLHNIFIFLMLLSTTIPALYIDFASYSIYGNILLSKVAAHIDSTPTTLCHTADYTKNTEKYSYAVIPLSTSLDSGYLIKIPNRISIKPLNIKYTEENAESFSAKTIGIVKCDKLLPP